MSVIRVNFLPEFYLGDDAVLLTLDGGGVLSDEGSEGRSASGHFYVDMSRPTYTLVVSRDEYVDVVYPWLSPN
jgi:hypothetical protein